MLNKLIKLITSKRYDIYFSGINKYVFFFLFSRNCFVTMSNQFQHNLDGMIKATRQRGNKDEYIILVYKQPSPLVWSVIGYSVFTMLFVFDRLLRETVLTIACEMGDPDALKQASDIFNQWIDEKLRYH